MADVTRLLIHVELLDSANRGPDAHRMDVDVVLKAVLTDGRQMSDRLAATWVAFAASGDPNNSLIPHWPAYEARRRATMVFDSDMRVADDYRGDFVRMIADAVPATPDPRKA